MKIVVSIILSSLLASACVAAASNDRKEDYRKVLRDEYPLFATKQLTFSMTGYVTDGLVFGDLLIGDFNGDSIEDFAAALVRKRSKTEAEQDPDKTTRHILQEGIAVVCNGVLSRRIANAEPTYECSYLAEPSLGGLEGELAFIAISSKDLPETKMFSGEQCTAPAKKHDGLRTHALMHSAAGYCIDIFYPIPNSSEYSVCIYCDY